MVFYLLLICIDKQVKNINLTLIVCKSHLYNFKLFLLYKKKDT